jgi:hypothetical protein
LADPNFRKTPTGQRVLAGQTGAPSGGLAGAGSIADILKGLASGGGAASTAEGVRKLTPADIANMQANAAAQLSAGLTGPFTPEAKASGYASIAAQLYGVNHPSAQSWVRTAIARGWDADTFGQWLRSKPEFAKTEVGRRMKADILAVIGQVFGRLA